MARVFFRRLVKLYPAEGLLAGPTDDRDGMVSYRHDLETELVQECTELVLRHVPEEILFRRGVEEGREVEEGLEVVRS